MESDVNRERPTVEVAESDVADWRSVPVLDAGTVLGRYTIVSELGSGGMGVVYRARDPSLDRDVALKVLRADRELGSDGARDEARLLREARALAQLSHPNVVSIYDVGVVDGSIFIAMELVAGETLRSWHNRGPHSRSEVLDAFVQAGRGLVAAHAQGLVHRDFKPDNVLVSSADGHRVCKVVDFGLARPVAASLSSGRSDEWRRASGTSSVEDLTEAGAVLGTPSYMAPEQHRGDPVDAAGDQYSFCVALYEALRGHKPFRGDTYEDLVAAKRALTFNPLPAKVRIDPAIDRVVARGLDPDPQSRWPSMAALLDALQAARRRRRRLAAPVATALLAATGSWWMLSAPSVDCDSGEAKMAEIWGSSARQRVRSALLASETGGASQRWKTVEGILDAYAERWLAQSREACVARERGEQGPIELDRRQVCLADRFDELGAVVEVLGSADPGVAYRAADVARTLPSLTFCADDERLGRSIAPPDDPRVAAQVRQLRVRLKETRAMAATGRYEQADDLAQEVLKRARALEYPPLVGEALQTAGSLRNSAGDYAASESLLTEGYWVAREVGHDTVAATIALELVLLLGDGLARFDEGLAWGNHARADLQRVDADSPLHLQLLINLGIVYSMQGDLNSAHRMLSESLEQGETIEGHINLGNVAAFRADLDEARGHYERAAELAEVELGPSHPGLATAIMNAGNIAVRTGDYSAAEVHYERAVAIYESTVGLHHPSLGNVMANMAIMNAAQKNYDVARGYFERATAIWEVSLGREHPVVGQSCQNLGRMLSDKGDYAEAVPLFRRALEIQEKAFGIEAAATVNTRANLARALVFTGEAQAARSHAERAVELSLGTGVVPSDRGAAQEALAYVLWELGEHEPALEHGREAVQLFAEAQDDVDGVRRHKVEAWLAERSGTGAKAQR